MKKIVVQGDKQYILLNINVMI